MRKGTETVDRKMNRLFAPRHLKRLLLRGLPSIVLLGVFGGCGDGGTGAPPTITDLCAPVSHDRSLKIIGGSECPRFEGSVARLEVFDEEDNAVRCSGVVIGPSKVLTAAHCFNEFTFGATIYVGGESRRVVDFIPHPNFRVGDEKTPNDVGVATLESPLSYPVSTVELGTPPAVGETIYIFGYGRTVVGEDVPRNETTLVGGTMIVSEITTPYIDAFYDGSTANTCRGDSGGPAYRFDLNTGKLTLIGLTSSGTNPTCGVEDLSSFTNLRDPANREFLSQFAPELSKTP